MSTAGCSGTGGPQTKGREAPLVSAAAVESMRFVDRIEAVGTARANEQVTLAAPVTER
ncbi:MAG: efflux transporter periplasmic adaptor subunit, partial [Sphingomonadales bacterium]